MAYSLIVLTCTSCLSPKRSSCVRDRPSWQEPVWKQDGTEYVILQWKFVQGAKAQYYEEQKVTIAVLPDQAPDVDALYAAIVSGGYEPVGIFSIDENGELQEYLP